jgi:transcriptional regulator GlxA family with amidase domain
MLAGYEFDEEPVFEPYLARDRTETHRALAVLNFLHTAPEGPRGVARTRELWAMTELLALWPHSLSRHILGPGTAAPTSIRKAIDFIEAHLDRDLDLSEVAQAACLGLRGLQDGFSKHVGESPGRYIRNRRLDAAYADLKTGNRGHVTEVATRWHFSNPGVFAKYFYDRFGLMPSSLRKKSHARRP